MTIVVRRVVICSVVLGGLGLVWVPTAGAARPCGTIAVPGQRPARVATVHVGCPEGIEVAAIAYGEIAKGRHSTHYRVELFRCSAVLAETEVSCQRGDEWVLASTQATDHPSEWHIPRDPFRQHRFLGTRLAAGYMRVALRQANLMGGGHAQRVKCNHRIEADRLRCRMSWIEGGFRFIGRGMIWLIYLDHRETWNYTYRILGVDEHCAMVEERHNCTKFISAG
jgi:hypothetical protein